MSTLALARWVHWCAWRDGRCDRARDSHDWREWARRKPLRLQMWRGPPRREHGAKAAVRLALAWRDPRWRRRGAGPGSVRSSGGSQPVVAAGGRTSQGRAPGSPRGPGQGGAGREKPRQKPRPGAGVAPGAEARWRVVAWPRGRAVACGRESRVVVISGTGDREIGNRKIGNRDRESRVETRAPPRAPHRGRAPTTSPQCCWSSRTPAATMAAAGGRTWARTTTPLDAANFGSSACRRGGATDLKVTRG